MISNAYTYGFANAVAKVAGFKPIINNKIIKSARDNIDVDMSDLMDMISTHPAFKNGSTDITSMFKSFREIQTQKAMSAFNYKQKVKDNIVRSVKWT